MTLRFERDLEVANLNELCLWFTMLGIFDAVGVSGLSVVVGVLKRMLRVEFDWRLRSLNLKPYFCGDRHGERSELWVCVFKRNSDDFLLNLL